MHLPLWLWCVPPTPDQLVSCGSAGSPRIERVREDVDRRGVVQGRHDRKEGGRTSAAGMWRSDVIVAAVL